MARDFYHLDVEINCIYGASGTSDSFCYKGFPVAILGEGENIPLYLHIVQAFIQIP